jgi:hypothetical protein
MKPPLFDDPRLDHHIRKLSLTKEAPPRRDIKETKEMHIGVIASWNANRGYGWIKSDGDVPEIPERELFLHATGLPRPMKSIAVGTRIEFVTKKSRAVGKPPEGKILRVITEMAEAA